tara:strand:- start:7 stop:1305 length:1299 start_codon:yes stop_codon:yes gene_type:complete
VNKILSLILIFLFFNNCSLDKSDDALDEKIINVKNIEGTRTILTKQESREQSFNTKLKFKISKGKFGTNSENNQNDAGELSYQGFLEKVGKYKYSNFKNFEYIETKPVFYNKNLIFFDDKGTIIYYDQNYKIVWKNNFYNKSEKKSKPRLNLAIHKNVLIVTDSVAKYYAIDVETGTLIWSKTNIVPFYSDIKIKGDFFYVVDFKNILKSISIKDGSELWNLKTEESITKSNTKLSIVIDNKNVYFNNSIGDITAVNINSGQLLWQLPTQNNDIANNAFQLSSSRLVINENSILFSNNKNEFYSIDIKTGLINWKNTINSVLSPVIIGNILITVSSSGYLYVVDKISGNILRINDLYINYDKKKRLKIHPTGFLVSLGKIYLTNDDGRLIIVDLNIGNILSTVKIASDKISRPHVHENNLYIIRNGSIIKFN